MTNIGIFASLTTEGQAPNFVTMRHIERVRNLINFFVCELLKRGERHNDGNIMKSIATNAERFDIDPQLAHIFENTAKLFDE
jgi:hypothetical protein